MECDVCAHKFAPTGAKVPFILLECAHTFCQECVEQLPFKKCPTCRAPFDKVKPNFRMVEALEHFHAHMSGATGTQTMVTKPSRGPANSVEGSHKCDVCADNDENKDASHVCLSERLKLCDTHAQKHQQRKPDHEVIRMREEVGRWGVAFDAGAATAALGRPLARPGVAAVEVAEGTVGTGRERQLTRLEICTRRTQTLGEEQFQDPSNGDQSYQDTHSVESFLPLPRHDPLWRQWTPRPRFVRFLRTFGTQGSGELQFQSPLGVAALGDGHVVVADTNNHRLQVATAEGAFVRIIGTYGSSALLFLRPAGVAALGDGRHIVVVEQLNHRLQVLTAEGAFVRTVGTYGNGELKFQSPAGVAALGDGRHIVVADTGNNRLQIVTAEGAFVRIIGTRGSGALQFRGPNAVAALGDGRHIVVADHHNDRLQVVTAEGAFVRTIGTQGSGELQFRGPAGVAALGDGCIVVADTGNDRLQVVTAEGVFVRIIGTRGSGAVQFRGPNAVAALGDGHVVVADTLNDRLQVVDVSVRLHTM